MKTDWGDCRESGKPFFQHLQEVLDEGRVRSKEAVQVDESKAVTEAVEEGVVTRTLGPHLGGISESSDLNSSRERGVKVSFKSNHPPEAVADVTSQSTYREDTKEKRNLYAQTGIATYVIVPRGGTRGSGEGKVFVGSTEPFSGNMCRGYGRKR